MTIPKANYVVDAQGEKMYVQLTIQDWENLLNELEQMEKKLLFKQKMKNAFRQVRQIQKGEKEGTSLNDFLNEL